MFIASRSLADTQPGNSDSCIAFVQQILPIALARPYVEQYVQEGTKVGRIHMNGFFIT